MKLNIKELTGNTITIDDIEPSMSILELKQKISTKCRCSQPEIMRLIYAGKSLDNQRTVGDYNLSDLYDIHIVLNLRGGGCAHSFNDVTKGNMNVLHFSKNASPWRRTRSGLTLLGFCRNFMCDAFRKDYVCVPKDYVRNMNILTCEAFCPICHDPIIVDNCGFSDCDWKMTCEKLNGEIKKTNFVSVEHVFSTFDDERNGSADFKYINITCIRQDDLHNDEIGLL
jgi:ubiquitin C